MSSEQMELCLALHQVWGLHAKLAPFPVAGTNTRAVQMKEGRVCLGSQFEGSSPSWRRHETASHITSIVRKQRKVNARFLFFLQSRAPALLAGWECENWSIHHGS